MKVIPALLFVLTVVSCSKPRRASESFPPLQAIDDAQWVTYEGILPTENGQRAHVELQLMPAAPGLDSYYRIWESLVVTRLQGEIAMSSMSEGTYSVLLGSPEYNIIKLNDRALRSSLMRGQAFGLADRVEADILLRSKGDQELVLMDDNGGTVNPEYRLIRRSELFTVEGYFTVYNGKAEYFERNTRKQWPVARFGSYDDAVNRYYSFAREIHEGIYLKALSYSTRQTDENGKTLDSLVIKKILTMDSTIVQ